ncbi:uncharacterized protein LOC122275684 [Carya illinoinensis]|uniref:uncharacterized protein LOC122275684 n=1 Tax=Carya illinoinensis TaxID=32201 RepID=UPI001C729C3B|nr:uncharacterized protein LOC122275684 [Carya illinoinensis]
MDIPLRRRAVQQIQLVAWKQLPTGLWKLNVDSSCRGNPGTCGGGGGVVCDHRGVPVGAFSEQFGVSTNTEAKLCALLHGVKFHKQLGGRRVILECDSKVIMDWLNARCCNLWYLWNFWDELLQELEGLSYQVVHQFCEGNQVADLLAIRCEAG